MIAAQPFLKFRLPDLGRFYRPMFGIMFGTFPETDKTLVDGLPER